MTTTKDDDDDDDYDYDDDGGDHDDDDNDGRDFMILTIIIIPPINCPFKYYFPLQWLRGVVSTWEAYRWRNWNPNWARPKTQRTGNRSTGT